MARCPFGAQKAEPTLAAGNNPEVSGQGQNRTADTRIFSPLLYQLSYLAGWPKASGQPGNLAGKRV